MKIASQYLKKGTTSKPLHRSSLSSKALPSSLQTFHHKSISHQKNFSHQNLLPRTSPFQFSSSLQRRHKKPFSTTPAARPIITKLNAPRFTVGDKIFGYKVTQAERISEMNFNAYLFKHEKIGAEHLHLETVDTNNVYCSIFKTIPQDSTGVAHILEHTTLCGSQKYPVRDPFFNMLKRSLNTFMNAWTGSDFTAYPFSTQNAQDFKNLLNVYLDAAFFPKLDYYDFLQEGHRLEFENGKLSFKGVVFNEMKGVMSNPDSYFAYKAQNLFYPGTTYGHNSGGDPKDIPKLTHSQLLDFQRKFYHPSNSRFFTYGHLPVEDHLEIIEEQVMKKFSPLEINESVGQRIPFSSPQTHIFKGPPAVEGSDEERQHKISITFAANDVEDYYETFVLSFLNHLLCGSGNSPLHIALLEPQQHREDSEEVFVLGTGSVAGGYDPSVKQTNFSFGLSGVREKDLELVEPVILRTLEACVEEGFPQERIDSLLHQIELSNKHVTSNLGLKITQNIENFWIHSLNPIEILKINKHVDRLKEDLKNPGFFQEKIKKYLLNNQDKLKVIMEPDPNFMKSENEEEQKQLQEIEKGLNESQIQEINQNADLLKQRQESQEDISCLPTLTVNDIPKQKPKTHFSVEQIQPQTPSSKPVGVQWTPQPTNGIAYFTSLMHVPSDLSPHLIPYLPLFCETLGEMPTKRYDHHELAQQLESYTGGISISPTLIANNNDILKGEAFLSMEAMGFYKNSEKVFDLLQEIAHTTKWDNVDLLRSLIMQKASAGESSIVSSGHSYASSLASGNISPLGFINEQVGGLYQVEFIQKWAKSDDLSELIHNLNEIRSKVIFKEPARCAMNAEESEFSRLKPYVSNFLSHQSQFGSKNFSNIAESLNFTAKTEKNFLTIPSSVNYVTKVLPSIPITHPDSVGLSVLSKVLSLNYLHSEIREKGGAYGSGLSSSGQKLTFYSYRDPNAAKTLKVFDHVTDWITRHGVDQKMLDEAKLSIFQDLDRPVPPSDKGKTFFQTGLDDEFYQKRRDKLFQISQGDLTILAQKYFSPEANANANYCIFGSKEALSEIDSSQWSVSSAGSHFKLNSD